MKHQIVSIPHRQGTTQFNLKRQIGGNEKVSIPHRQGTTEGEKTEILEC